MAAGGIALPVLFIEVLTLTRFEHPRQTPAFLRQPRPRRSSSPLRTVQALDDRVQPAGRNRRRPHIGPLNTLARERLCSYLARPAFSLARLGVRRDGLVVYRVKNAGCSRVQQRGMSQGGSGAKGGRRLAHRAARAVRAAWSGRGREAAVDGIGELRVDPR